VNDGPNLRFDAYGEDVRRLQRLLVMLGHLPYDALTGHFDEAARYAVRLVQTGAGLPATGVVDDTTWEVLPPDPVTPVLRAGDEGVVVASLQAALTEVRGPGEVSDPGPADGVFGPATTRAVRAFQSDVDITVDGVVGDQTWWVPADADGTTLAKLAQLTTA
jgi:peptidoglycan hydrolase-like protein with peptidoglycan-binding domain